MSIWRLLICSLIGAVFSVFYVFMDKHTFAIKIVLSSLMVLILKEKYTIKSYIFTLIILYIVSFVFAGATLMIEGVLPLENNLLPFALSAGVILSAGGLQYAVKHLYKKRNMDNFHYQVEVLSKSGDNIRWVGYYDSGNKLYDSDNQPIIVISQGVLNKLGYTPTGEIAVNTVGGVKILKTVKLHYKIYYAGDKNKIYETNAAISNSFSTGRGEYDIILHRDMGGINE